MKKGYCNNLNNYHSGCEVHNFSETRDEPYEECGKFCDNCPYFVDSEE